MFSDWERVFGGFYLFELSFIINSSLEVSKWVFVCCVAKEQIVDVLIVKEIFAMYVVSLIPIVQNAEGRNLNMYIPNCRR